MADIASLRPAIAGTSFKPEHLPTILDDHAFAGFFEVHAENYMGAGGAPHAMLERIRRDHPVSIHGVAMSIGNESGFDPAHLRRFAALVERYEPALVSEHLAWSTHDGVYFNDLLPLPYDARTLSIVAAHVSRVQDEIGRPILIENPSHYLIFEDAAMPETEFLRELARRTGCGLLLDLNNVVVSAANRSESAAEYLAHFPLHAVGELHLAGHHIDLASGTAVLIDSHGAPVGPDVWDIFERLVASEGPIPTLVEWDNDLPDWPVLRAEAEAAQAILDWHLPISGSVRRHA